MNAGNSGEASASQHVSQHCLCLIVRSVRRRNSRELSLFHQRSEKFIARSSRRILYIQLLSLRPRRNVHALNKKFQPMPLCQFRDKLLVRVSRASA